MSRTIIGQRKGKWHYNVSRYNHPFTINKAAADFAEWFYGGPSWHFGSPKKKKKGKKA